VAVGRILILLVTGLTIAACGIGASAVKRDHFDYNTAIAQSWKDQMLLNVVKLRYADTPAFLEVTSVISQYELESGLSASVLFLLPGSDEVFLGGNARYTERPTITFSPLSGGKFTRKLVTPLPPEGVLLLLQSGWPAVLLLRLTVQSINGLQNKASGMLNRAAAPEFEQVIQALSEVQKSGAIGIRIKHDKDGAKSIMIFDDRDDPNVREQLRSIRDMLRLDPLAKEYRIVFGRIAKDSREIAMLTRSLIQIMFELSSFTEVPAEHLAKGFVAQRLSDEQIARSAFRIRSSKDKPDSAFAMVRYLDHWYSIAQGDVLSKGAFTLLLFLSSLTESETKGTSPIVTIPTR
jgi:hypothetical protein